MIISYHIISSYYAIVQYSILYYIQRLKHGEVRAGEGAEAVDIHHVYYIILCDIILYYIQRLEHGEVGARKGAEVVGVGVGE